MDIKDPANQGITDARSLGVPRMLILGLQRGDLAWRDIVNPKKN